MTPSTLEKQDKRMSRCHICDRLLDQADDPTTKDCGGDCLRCMAEIGDPDCLAAMKEIESQIDSKLNG